MYQIVPSLTQMLCTVCFTLNVREVSCLWKKSREQWNTLTTTLSIYHISAHACFGDSLACFVLFWSRRNEHGIVRSPLPPGEPALESLCSFNFSLAAYAQWKLLGTIHGQKKARTVLFFTLSTKASTIGRCYCFFFFLFKVVPSNFVFILIHPIKIPTELRFWFRTICSSENYIHLM